MNPTAPNASPRAISSARIAHLPPQPDQAAPTHQPHHPGPLSPRRGRPDVGDAPPRATLPRPAGQATGASGASNLVVVSNRLPDLTKPAAGGLAVALGEMSPEAKILWFGWSNKTKEGPQCVALQQVGRTTFARVDLTEWQSKNYYAGFANEVLWPICHEKPDFAEIKPEYFEAYKQVNKMFASHLAPMVKEGDVIWIHDYHLIPLAEELRALGCSNRMGFFNHIPLPPPEVIKEIPQHGELMKALFSYDLVGMQQPRDVNNLLHYLQTEGAGEAADGARVNAFGRSALVRDFPIGIDPGKFRALTPALPRSKVIVQEVRDEAAHRLLMIGVDRLDYSKGIPERLEAYAKFLGDHPHMQGRVTFVQVASPTRGTVPAYKQLSAQTSQLVDDINQAFRAPGWEPVIYYNEEVERGALPELYRASRVGVITPSVDGMNLVAKEYVAAQLADDPGVPVLSERAGAATQLKDALLVPPFDRTAIAVAYERALKMSLAERQDMHAKLDHNVTTEDLAWWRESYLAMLNSVPTPSARRSAD